MKKIVLLPLGGLLLTLLLAITGRPVVQIEAIDPNWIVAAEEENPGDFAFSVEVTPTSILAQDEYFFTSANPNPYETYSYETNYETDSFLMDFTGLFISMIGDPEERAPYMTLGFADDNFGMINSYYNMGRLTKIGFDIAEDMYEDVETELAGMIGLQVREGKNADFSSAENEGAGPTHVDDIEWIVEWDLTWRTTDVPSHEGFTPLFNDETRLDDISNFRIITLSEVHFERIFVEGYHFFEAYNETPYYYAAYEETSISEDWGLTFNFDNRTDDDYEIDDSSAITPALQASEEYVEHDIPFAVDSEDGLITLDMVVPVIVVEAALPLMELTLTDPETTPDMPVSITGWVSALASATYGNQTIDTAYLDTTRNVDIVHRFGIQTADIMFFSATIPLQVNVTNQGVTIAEPDPQTMGGNLVSMVTYSENVDTVDHYEGEDPSAYYTEYTFNPGGFLTLKQGFESQGTKVQEMHFTITILARTPYAGSDPRNGFNIWLRDEQGANIEDTARYIEILPEATVIYVDYVNVSAYKAVSFYMEMAEIEDALFTFRFSMTGTEYDADYFSNEDQALFYAQAFVTMTENVGGEGLNGICEGLSSAQWTLLSNEYSYMSWDTQSLFVDNDSKMQSADIEAMLSRYQYLNGIDSVTYSAFLNEEEPLELMPQHTKGEIGEVMSMLALLSFGTLAFYYFRKRLQHRF